MQEISHWVSNKNRTGIVFSYKLTYWKFLSEKQKNIPHRSMVRNMKETFQPKTGMWKKQVLQDPGYVEDVKDACCMLSAK